MTESFQFAREYILDAAIQEFFPDDAASCSFSQHKGYRSNARPNSSDPFLDDITKDIDLNVPYKFVYRTIPRFHPHWKAVQSGKNIHAKNKDADISVREHLLNGSSSTFKGSPFISTTGDLKTAMKFACPIHPVIAIDLELFAAMGGSYKDLSTDALYRQHVPPEAGDETENHIQDLGIDGVGTIFPSNERISRQIARDAHWLYTEAGKTEWDCCKIFANRSLEILLEREIPIECITVLEYEICSVQLDQYKYPTREIPSIDFANGIIGDSCEPVGGANSGQTKFKYHGSERTFICKQSKCNVQRALLSEEEMRHRISTEFAAFSIYSTANHHIPDLNTHVPCCAKFEFRYRVSKAKYSFIVEMDVEDNLNCLVMRNMDTKPLESRRLWMPKESFEEMKFGRPVAEYDHKCIVDWHGLAKYCGLTHEDFRRKFPCDDNQKYRLIFHTPHSDVESACTGLVLDALLANEYGWGTYNKCRLSREQTTGRIIRMSTEQCLGNVEVEVLNYDGQQNVAKIIYGTLELFKISMENPQYVNWKIPTFEIRRQCIRLLKLLKESLAAYPADYNEPFAGLQLPADLTRQYRLYPDHFHYAKNPHPHPDRRWENYLANRCDNLLNEVNEQAAESAEMSVAYFSDALLRHSLDFAHGHSPFLEAFRMTEEDN